MADERQLRLQQNKRPAGAVELKAPAKTIDTRTGAVPTEGMHDIRPCIVPHATHTYTVSQPGQNLKRRFEPALGIQFLNCYTYSHAC